MKSKSNHFFLIFVVGLFFLFTASACKIYTACNQIVSVHKDSYVSSKIGTPRLEYYESIPVIHLYGSSREMGEQYGQLLKEQLHSIVDIVRVLFSAKTINKYTAQAKQSFNNVPPELAQFIKGVAVASGIDEEEIMAINVVPRVTCSVLAVWDDATENGNLLMGRNADYRFKKVNKAIGILVVKHPDNAFATITSSFIGVAGGFTGMNEKGVCFGNMLVYNGISNKVNTAGLPIQLLMQMAGEREQTARGMINYLAEQKHMIPENVMCADTNEAIIAELSQTNNVLREGSKGVLAASNFFYSTGMFNKPEADQRFADLMLMSKKNYGLFNLDYLQKAMHKARRKNQNLQCVMFDPAQMKMHVSMNKVPASEGPFTEFDVAKLFSE